MKTNKKALAMLTAGLLAVTPMAATGLTAFADTITVTPIVEGTHNYSAYQILKGDVSGGTLSNINWGDNMPADKTDFINALKNDTVFGTGTSNLFYSLTAASTAEDFAGIIKNITAESTQANELSKVLGNFVTGAAVATDNATPYQLEGLDGGYYLVKDTAAITNSNPRTLNLLKVAGNVTITTKEDLPTLTKVITSSNQNAAGTANTASIGDIVEYRLQSVVPDMEGYTKYFFVVNDTMEDGLTFNASSVSISIKDHTTGDTIKDLDLDTDYEVQTGASADGYTFQIVFKNFIQYNSATYIDNDIFIDYNATVNNSATAGGELADANTNTANLTYSNNPNIVSEGKSVSEPDEPKPPTPDDPDTPGDQSEPGDPVGDTPDQTTYTYLTELVIEKVDASDDSIKLPNAKFELTGTSLNSVLHESGLYVKDDSASPAYYLLENGTYTDTAPDSTSPLSAGYASAQKYAYTVSASLTGTEVAVNAFGTSASGTGRLTFGKLGEGKYTIKETAAPSGYNSLSTPITITITATPTTLGCTWSYQKDTDAAAASNVIQIQNASGATLPSTGGIGTKLFYIIGSMLVAGSIVLLVTKKRMGSKEN
ncbi:isopeptide-forming domain-containing fimbrial protein [Ruminococcus sp.]|uniref:isopeptide-forming domain-containing fimbrial protein n=1 Tax=Ruminococcus sp. TaxID=41978 RepID=UPI0025F8869B|nr:isopeptide-forming domain-containing fimbrial protein [Ruminococcus sp.]